MKKIVSFNLALFVLAFLCSCANAKENTDTQFCFDTVVTLTAECDKETLDGAFSLCKNYENLLSKTVEKSDVYKLNTSLGKQKADKDTRELLKKAVYYGKISNGKFDVTLYDVISLWDFNNEVVPSKNEIAEALKNVDYQSIKLYDDGVDLCSKKIDLGGIAKGFIADKVLEYFKGRGAKNGIINLGGNIIVFGQDDKVIGIKKPFSELDVSATVTVKNKSVVTSGIYERCFEKDGKFYHHILDVKTGFPADTDLASATIISDKSVDGDALSTICILSGSEAALELIENTENTECILIDKSEKIYYSSGLYRQADDFYLKNK